MKIFILPLFKGFSGGAKYWSGFCYDSAFILCKEAQLKHFNGIVSDLLNRSEGAEDIRIIQLLRRTKLRLRELTLSVLLLGMNTNDPSEMLALLQCIVDRILAQIEMLLNCVLKPFSANGELFMQL